MYKEYIGCINGEGRIWRERERRRRYMDRVIERERRKACYSITYGAV